MCLIKVRQVIIIRYSFTLILYGLPFLPNFDGLLVYLYNQFEYSIKSFIYIFFSCLLLNSLNPIFEQPGYSAIIIISLLSLLALSINASIARGFLSASLRM